MEIINETAIWRSREVKYVSGNWTQISRNIPLFELGNFSEGTGEIVNKYYKTVIRLPLTQLENRIPVGIVSNTYTLAQHYEVAKLCIDGLRNCNIGINDVHCELGLSTLSEWMNFRIYFPEKYDFTSTDSNPLKLRLECFNSVDGSSQLTILFGWFRLICSNGMVIGKTVSELRDIHNKNMDLSKISSIISEAMFQVQSDKKMMSRWGNTQINSDSLANWVDTTVSKKWGKKAAFKVFHVCLTGHDSKYADPFESERPSRKSMIKLAKVPGSPNKAKNLYDIAQALSWIATSRKNAEERTKWQTEVPKLLDFLRPE